MRLLHVFVEIKYSGAEIMYVNAAPLIKEAGIDQLALSTGKCPGNFVDGFIDAGIKVYHKPLHFREISFGKVKYYLDFFKFLKDEKINIVHIHRSDLYLMTLISFLAGVKCIKTQHSTFRNPWYTVLYQILARLVTRRFLNVTYQSIGGSVYKNELEHYKNPTKLINNWYDDKRFFPALNGTEKKDLRDKYNIPQNAFVIISTGNCSHTKNHKDILNALRLVKGKTNFLYLHLGHGETEAYERILCEELGISSSVRFLGNLINVRDYLVLSDIFVMTSKFEGLGNAAIEAMACKVPVILYDVYGLRDLISRDNMNGLLIKANYNVLADSIVYCKENSFEIDKFSENAMNFVLKHFSMENNVSKIIDLYKS